MSSNVRDFEARPQANNDLAGAATDTRTAACVRGGNDGEEEKQVGALMTRRRGVSVLPGQRSVWTPIARDLS